MKKINLKKNNTIVVIILSTVFVALAIMVLHKYHIIEFGHHDHVEKSSSSCSPVFMTTTDDDHAGHNH